VSCRVEQTWKTARFVNDPSSILAAGEHFGIITSREQSDRALGHVLFIFKVNFRSQIMLERVDVTFRFLFRNLPPSAADRARGESSNRIPSIRKTRNACLVHSR